MKLLIIEDEPDLMNLLVQYMRKEGHVCETAATFKQAYKKINNHDYDFAIIDSVLPGGEGLSLVKILHKEAPQTGVVLISDQDEFQDRIKGLETGADDYLIKPFHLAELHARMRAILRRKTNQQSNELNFPNLSIQLDERRVIANGIPLDLTKKEYDILVYLARNKNRVVTKDNIAEHLWGDYMDNAISYDFIYTHVKNLRKKLMEQDCGHFLKTVYGVGYKFTLS